MATRYKSCIKNFWKSNQKHLRVEEEQGVGDNLSAFGLKLHVVIEKIKIKSHVIKGSCCFMGGSYLRYVTTLASLVNLRMVIVET